ncbi:MAG: hypothetical protein ACI9M9_000250 [Flavobacteriaceae bacterium]|jgi:hypothetical protein
MKKNYFLAVLFVFGTVTANAQFLLDDMESYGGGNAPIFGAQWGSWGGSTADALMSSGNQSQSGALSGYVDDSTVTDALLLLGDKIFGSWGVKFSLYIPAGKEGYMNMQGVEAAGVQFVVGNWYYNQGGSDGGTGNISNTAFGLASFTYPEDQWFDVVMNFDFNSGAGASTWTLWIDNVNVVPEGTPYSDDAGVYATSLGGIDLYSISAGNEMYIDDVEQINAYYPDPTLGVNDLNAVGFTAYPNPVKNVLNLQANEEITSAVVYNVLGQEVYNANINALTATIDMASFASGAYFVKVNVGGTEGVVKVLK